MKKHHGKHTGKQHRGEAMHMKSKKGKDHFESEDFKGTEMPSMCDSECYSPGEHYQGGSGPNEKHG